MIEVRARYKNSDGYYTEDRVCDVETDQINNLLRNIETYGIKNLSGEKAVVKGTFIIGDGRRPGHFLITLKPKEKDDE